MNVKYPKRPYQKYFFFFQPGACRQVRSGTICPELLRRLWFYSTPRTCQIVPSGSEDIVSTSSINVPPLTSLLLSHCPYNAFICDSGSLRVPYQVSVCQTRQWPPKSLNRASQPPRPRGPGANGAGGLGSNGASWAGRHRRSWHTFALSAPHRALTAPPRPDSATLRVRSPTQRAASENASRGAGTPRRRRRRRVRRLRVRRLRRPPRPSVVVQFRRVLGHSPVPRTGPTR